MIAPLFTYFFDILNNTKMAIASTNKPNNSASEIAPKASKLIKNTPLRISNCKGVSLGVNTC